MQFRNAFQINSGLGAGNIGDDLVAQALWRRLPDDFQLLAGVFENYRQLRNPYPARVQYVLDSGPEHEYAGLPDVAGLLAGITLPFDLPLTAWPLGFLAPRLAHFHRRGLPVDAVGVTVEPNVSEAGRALFASHFLPIRSWSVVDDASAGVLAGLGVAPERIVVGADFAWLQEGSTALDEWAAETWRSLTVDPDRPLLAVNIHWPAYADGVQLSQALSAALDSLPDELEMQIAFLCTDCRHPGSHRTSAELVQSFMNVPSVLVPNEYFSPDELIALLRYATVALGRPYRFGYAAVIAGTVPVFLASRREGREQCRELGLAPCGTPVMLDAPAIVAAVRAAITNRTEILLSLDEKRRELATRAKRNLDHFELFHGIQAEMAMPVDSPAGIEDR